MSDLFGIKLMKAPFEMVRDVPNKKHKKRSNQSARYHARIQKKWIKRFGTHKEKYALMINGAALGIFGGGPRMVLDAATFGMLRNFA